MKSTSDNNNSVYLSGVDNVMKDITLFSSDNIHPNQQGYYYLAKAIYNSMIQGFAHYTQTFQPSSSMNLNSIFSSSSSFNFSRTIQDNLAYFTYNFNLIIPSAVSLSNNNLIISNGTTSSNYNFLLGYQSFPRYPINLKVTYNDNSIDYYSSYFSKNSNGEIFIYINNISKPISSIVGLQHNVVFNTNFI